MSVVIETTLGDITVDLYLDDRPRACLNFLKLCKIKYYNYNLFHTISRGFIAQTGDPTGSRSGGESIFGVLDGPLKRFFEGENEPRIKHTKMGLISFVGNEERMIGSQFFLTLGEDLTYLDEKHCVFGEVVEGFDVLEVINEVICDKDDRPYQDVRITHTVILDDPYPDPKRLLLPSRSPSPSAERLQGGRIAPDEEIDEMEGKTAQEISELQAEREAKARATILEMVGDLPDADMAPPENVLFVCKLNPVTNDDDLEIIFSRFGKIKSCEVIRDKKTGDSLQYAFVEFEEQKSCEDAYFKMDNVLIDDRRIHVDFSQSVSKVKWHGKGRGVTHYDDKGKKSRHINSDIGKGNYKNKINDNVTSNESRRNNRRVRDRSETPSSNINNHQRGNLSDARRDRDSSKYRRERSPRRDRDSISPQRSKSKYNRETSRVKRDRSRSPTGRSTSPVGIKKKEYSRSPPSNRNRGRSPKIKKYESKEERYKSSSSRRSQSPRRDRDQSKNYRDNSARHNNRSKSPKRSNGRRNGYDHEANEKYGASSSRKVSSSESKSREREKNVEVKVKEKNKGKLRSKHRSSYSESDDEPRKQTRKEKNKKKLKYSSSNSDSDKQVKSKSSSSDSSDSDNYNQKKSRKKKVKKRSKSTSSNDSVEYKKKKSKKKKKKYESDSD